MSGDSDIEMLDAPPPSSTASIKKSKKSKNRTRPGATADHPITLFDDDPISLQRSCPPTIRRITPPPDNKRKLNATLEQSHQHLLEVDRLEIKPKHCNTSSASAGPSFKRPKLQPAQSEPIDLTLEDTDTSSDVLELPELDHGAFSWDYTTKEQRKELVERAADDEDYDTLYESMHPYQSANWSNAIELAPDERLTSSFDGLSILAPRHSQRIKGTLPVRSHTWALGLPGLVFQRPTGACKFSRSQGQRLHYTVPQSNSLRSNKVVSPMAALYEVPLQLAVSFNEGSGTVNQITQHEGMIAIASATEDGLQEESGAYPRKVNPHNYKGNLRFWRHNKLVVVPKAHTVPKKVKDSLDGRTTINRWCTVNEAKFDPHLPGRITSIGHDGLLCFWDEDGQETGRHKYPGTPAPVPYGLYYHHQKNLLAVSCNDGFIQMHRNSEQTPTMTLKVSHTHPIGALKWGHGQTEGYLFASTENPDDDDDTGIHKMFEVESGKLVSSFGIHDGGDAMAIDPIGNTVALCTNGQDGHQISLFDIWSPSNKRRRQHSEIKLVKPRRQTQLEEFVFPDEALIPYTDDKSPPLPEVTSMSFSPDGILIMVARNDNEVHVYDSRFLGEGENAKPLMYVHDGDDKTMGIARYGVHGAQWVEGWGGLGLGIVSGGQDGCVTLWDVKKAGDDLTNRQVLAQLDSDIAHFSIGDEYKGEKPLVVGDSRGSVYIYDRTGRLEDLEP